MTKEKGSNDRFRDSCALPCSYFTRHLCFVDSECEYSVKDSVFGFILRALIVIYASREHGSKNLSILHIVLKLYIKNSIWGVFIFFLFCLKHAVFQNMSRCLHSAVLQYSSGLKHGSKRKIIFLSENVAWSIFISEEKWIFLFFF